MRRRDLRQRIFFNAGIVVRCKLFEELVAVCRIQPFPNNGEGLIKADDVLFGSGGTMVWTMSRLSLKALQSFAWP